MNNDLKCSLWGKQAKSGLNYFFGHITLEGNRYSISGFKNTSENPKSPEIDLIFKKVEEGPKKEIIKPHEMSDVPILDPFANFAKENPINDDDLPF